MSSWAYFRERRDLRIAYMSVYKKRLEALAAKHPSEDSIPELTTRMQDLEMKIDVEDLMIYRQRAENELQTAKRLAQTVVSHASEKEETPSKKGWPCLQSLRVAVFNAV